MNTTAAKAAKEIKTLLQKAYPTVSFSVRSQNYSNGNSVSIRWNLGPIEEDIYKLVSKFQYGHFDGMTDMYEYSNTRSDIPQSKYVHCTREYKTEEEVDNDKIGFGKHGYQHLWLAERTLIHIIAKDLSKLMGFEYKGLADKVPDDYKYLVSSQPYHADFRVLVYQLLQGVTLMHGYHGVRRIKDKESGQEIINSLEIY